MLYLVIFVHLSDYIVENNSVYLWPHGPKIISKEFDETVYSIHFGLNLTNSFVKKNKIFFNDFVVERIYELTIRRI